MIKIILDKIRIIWIMAIVGVIVGICRLPTPKNIGPDKILIASWYDKQSLRKEGAWARTSGIMANGQKFNPNNFTCATWDWPIGACLVVRTVDTGRSVVVRVTDRTSRRFAGKRIDLSRGAFATLENLNTGLIKVRVKQRGVMKKKSKIKFKCNSLRKGKCTIGGTDVCNPFNPDGSLCCFAKEIK